MIDYRKIECFLAVAENLSFSKGALQLNISTPGITKQIDKLESELGFKLFYRTTKKNVLTSKGIELLKIARSIRRHYLSDMHKIEELMNQKALIRIGFFEGLQQYEVIQPIVNLLEKNYPTYHFDIEVNELWTIVEKLEHNELDLCITEIQDYAFSKWEHLNHVIISNPIPAEIVISDAHSWFFKKQICENDIKAEQFLLIKEKYPDPSSFYYKIPCRSRKYLPNFPSLIVAMEMGEGFAVTTREYEYDSKHAFKYFSLPPQYKFSYYTSCLYNKKCRPEISQFANFLKTNIKNNFS